ncbi:60 kDa inner membrane insertion protein [Acidothermus cellulolyticus 11B]|uniref:Membrane protein insertase YidC n=1 Tax=Acidothermus cellulolyticus (strain ATCC 43068 / DSM 8971 / 11B) TaxID=351607 RepID=A0LWX0_ACIC1|nr:membrane protein insertase YidC [Acidothermus cellulolyticus]ABK53930.1 60 kDa inner membrane insertion protein [Acidothermus cellulolyticus 11B]
MPHLLNWLYELVTRVLLALHAALAPAFGTSSGVTWGLSVVLLTVIVRILLFPLFVKQVRSQRAMTELAPKLKELQAKYKNDRERLGTETMALYREHGVNPFMGCLPILAQAPVFYALFHVLRYVSDHGSSKPPAGFHPEYGWTVSLLQSAGHAKVFGVPLALGFRTADRAPMFGADSTTVHVVTLLAILAMATTTFLTQRQLIVKNAAAGNPMAQQQKMLLYVLPPIFALSGLLWQMGVLVYWVTSNLWSLGQQHYIIRTMPIKGPGGTAPSGDQRRLTASTQAAAPVVIRRQQVTRPPRSKRSGRRPQRPGSAR